MKNEKANNIDEPDSPARGVDRRPVPDPTSLTTQQLRREILSLRELQDTRIDSLRDDIREIRKRLDEIPAEIVLHVGHSTELSETKFSNVQVQFAERDTRVGSALEAQGLAVQAAFQAAKEVTAKTETTTIKLLDQLDGKLQAAVNNSDGKINDLKDRLNLIEGRTAGITSATQTQQSSIGMTVAVIAAVIGAFTGIGGLLVAMSHIAK